MQSEPRLTSSGMVASRGFAASRSIAERRQPLRVRSEQFGGHFADLVERANGRR